MKDMSMFELKLKTFAFIPQQVNDGIVMITCADDIVVFDPSKIRIGLCLLSHVLIELECSSGVVAFAHPSPLHIGNTHGVFVVEDEEGVLRKVKKYLHKPSNEEMKEAIFVKDGKEMVFTDSSYFFFSDVTRKLVKVVVFEK
jgi:fucose-1-phosphate guanylyltransferase